MIHTTAIVPASAKLGQNVEIGAYAVLEDGVEIGDNSLIEAHAHIKRGARIGRGCSVGSFATVSGDPQDLHFDRATVSFVEIGDGTAVREGATVHRATAAGGSTRVGKNCLLMANSHIGHDCVVGDRCILAPFCALGGFVRMGNDAFVSGGVMLHQKIRVGDGVMISGVSAFSEDIPPYVNAHKAQHGCGHKSDRNAPQKYPRCGGRGSQAALYGGLFGRRMRGQCGETFGPKGVFDSRGGKFFEVFRGTRQALYTCRPRKAQVAGVCPLPKKKSP